MQMEKYGAPGVLLVSSNFLKDARSAAADWLMPNIRIVTLPSEKWYRLRGTVPELRPLVEAAFSQITDALTKPVTAEEATPRKRPAVEYPSVRITGNSYEDAVEKFNASFLENKMGDGLPLVPPTREAVARMLKGTSRSPSEVIGKIPMKSGIATIEKIAINAVMAGALPTHMPVLIAAVQALMDPRSRFDTFGVSTGSWAPFFVINGPIRKDIHINCSSGALSPGDIANAAIGRAVGLIVKNIGGVRKGIEDMGVIGNPMNWNSIIIAENEEASPWKPFHVQKGFKPAESVISIFTGLGIQPGQGAKRGGASPRGRT